MNYLSLYAIWKPLSYADDVSTHGSHDFFKWTSPESMFILGVGNWLQMRWNCNMEHSNVQITDSATFLQTEICQNTSLIQSFFLFHALHIMQTFKYHFYFYYINPTFLVHVFVFHHQNKNNMKKIKLISNLLYESKLQLFVLLVFYPYFNLPNTVIVIKQKDLLNNT